MGFEQAAPWLAATLAAAYLIGGLPFGLWIARAIGVADLRTAGSGNIGATNMLRVGGVRPALVTLMLDVAKGFTPTALALAFMGPLPAAVAGLGAFLGHCFSPYLRLGGGKGVATGFGVLLAWRWDVALLAAVAWIATAALTRRSSAGALAATAAALIALPRFEEWTYLFAFAPMAAITLWRHRGNIARLIRGEEPPIALGRRPEAP